MLNVSHETTMVELASCALTNGNRIGDQGTDISYESLRADVRAVWFWGFDRAQAFPKLCSSSMTMFQAPDRRRWQYLKTLKAEHEVGLSPDRHCEGHATGWRYMKQKAWRFISMSRVQLKYASAELLFRSHTRCPLEHRRLRTLSW
jgi:hypothetical protein